MSASYLPVAIYSGLSFHYSSSSSHPYIPEAHLSSWIVALTLTSPLLPSDLQCIASGSCLHLVSPTQLALQDPHQRAFNPESSAECRMLNAPNFSLSIQLDVIHVEEVADGSTTCSHSHSFQYLAQGVQAYTEQQRGQYIPLAHTHAHAHRCTEFLRPSGVLDYPFLCSPILSALIPGKEAGYWPVIRWNRPHLGIFQKQDRWRARQSCRAVSLFSHQRTMSGPGAVQFFLIEVLCCLLLRWSLDLVLGVAVLWVLPSPRCHIHSA